MRQRIVLFVLCGLSLTMVSLLGARYWILDDEVQPPEPTKDASASAADHTIRPREDAQGEAGQATLNIIKMVGPVEHRTKNNAWIAAQVGDVLGKQHSLRTTNNSSAVVRVGDRSQLMISPSTEVSVREINEKIHTFRLDHGRLSVDYKKDGSRRIRIENDTGAIAEAIEGKFSVMRTRTSMAVATETGTVDLQAAGHKILLQAREQSVVLDDQPPTTPMAIPKSVLMKIAGLSEKPIEIRGDNVLLKGATQIGNRVMIRGAQVPVDAQGQFSQRVTLKPGLNRVLIEIEDPAGKQRNRVVEYFALAPDGKIEEIKLRWTQER